MNDNFINIKSTKLKVVPAEESKNGSAYQQFMFGIEREGAENLVKKLSAALSEDESEGVQLGIRLSKKVSKAGNSFLSSFGFVFARKPMPQRPETQAPQVGTEQPSPASDFNFDAL